MLKIQEMKDLKKSKTKTSKAKTTKTKTMKTKISKTKTPKYFLGKLCFRLFRNSCSLERNPGGGHFHSKMIGMLVLFFRV